MSENKVLNINELYALAQQNTFSIQGITNLLKGHEDRLSKVEAAVSGNTAKITSFEENERIDAVDWKRVKRAINSRCDYLLEIVRENGLPIKECIKDDKRFSSRFRRRAYVDCKAHSRMGQDYRETKKRDLPEVMEYIERWEPEVAYEGLTGAKAYKRYLVDRDAS